LGKPDYMTVIRVFRGEYLTFLSKLKVHKKSLYKRNTRKIIIWVDKTISRKRNIWVNIAKREAKHYFFFPW
jgi:hypothetical protein